MNSAAPRRAAATATMAVAAMLMGATLVSAGHFGDVNPNSAHEPGIEYVADAGITEGCRPGEFCPRDNLTRDQMATFIHRLSGNAPGVAPSVNAHRLEGFSAAELMAAGGEQGPQGDPGQQGPQGDPGQQGPQGDPGGLETVVRVSEQNSVQNQIVNQVFATCPAGTMVTGGGSTFSAGKEWVPRISTPFTTGQGWTVSYIPLDGLPGNSSVTVRALCVPVAA